MVLPLYFFDLFLALAQIYSSNTEGFHHFFKLIEKKPCNLAAAMVNCKRFAFKTNSQITFITLLQPADCDSVICCCFV